jgi:zinc ribbon protein
MILYGTKTITLKTIDLPISCTACNHHQQQIQVYRKFFSLFFIPVFPFLKNALISCTNCGNQMKLKQFFKDFNEKGKDVAVAKTHMKSLIKEAKTPFYTYATTGLALAVLAGFGGYFYYEEHRMAMQASAYAQQPIDNVLLVYKDEEEAYPYHIAYIPKIEDKEAVFFGWNYSYLTASDAKSDLSTVRNAIFNNTVKKNFGTPLLIPVTAFSTVGEAK